MKKRTPSASAEQEQPVAKAAKAPSKPTAAAKSAGKKSPATVKNTSKTAAKPKAVITPRIVGTSGLPAEIQPEPAATTLSPAVDSPSSAPLPGVQPHVAENSPKKTSNRGGKNAPAEAAPPQPVAVPQPDVIPPPRKVILPVPGFGDAPKIVQIIEPNIEPTPEPNIQPAPEAVAANIPAEKSGKKKPSKKKQEESGTTPDEPPASSAPLPDVQPPVAENSPKKTSNRGGKNAPAEAAPPQPVAVPQPDVIPPPRKVILPVPGFGDAPKIVQIIEPNIEPTPEPNIQPAPEAVAANIPAEKSGKKKPAKKKQEESGTTPDELPAEAAPPQPVAVPQPDVIPPPRKVILPPPGFGDAPKIEKKTEPNIEPTPEPNIEPAPEAEAAKIPAEKSNKKKSSKKKKEESEITPDAPPTSSASLPDVQPPVAGNSPKKTSKRGGKPAPAEAAPPQPVAEPQPDVIPPPRKVILPPPGFGDAPKIEQEAEPTPEPNIEPVPEAEAVSIPAEKSNKKKPSKKKKEESETTPDEPHASSAPLPDIQPHVAENSPKKTSKRGGKPAPAEAVPPQPVAAPQPDVIPPPRKVILPPPGFGDTPKIEQKAEPTPEPNIEPLPEAAANIPAEKSGKKKPSKKKKEESGTTPDGPHASSAPLPDVQPPVAENSPKKTSKRGGKPAPAEAAPPQPVAVPQPDVIPPSRKVILPPPGFGDAPKIEKKTEPNIEPTPEPNIEPVPEAEAVSIPAEKSNKKKSSKKKKEESETTPDEPPASSAPLLRGQPSSAGDSPKKTSKRGGKPAPAEAVPPQPVAVPQPDIIPPPRKVILPPPGFGDAPKIEKKTEPNIEPTPEPNIEPVPEAEAANIPAEKSNKKKSSKKKKEESEITPDEPPTSSASLPDVQPPVAENSPKKTSKKGGKPASAEAAPPQPVAVPQPDVIPPPRKVILPPPGFGDAPKIEKKTELNIEPTPEPNIQPAPEAAAANISAEKSNKKKPSKKKQEESGTTPDAPPASSAPLLRGQPSSAGDSPKKTSKRGGKPTPAEAAPPQPVAAPQPDVIPPPRKIILPPPGFEDKVEPNVEKEPVSKPESLPVAATETPVEKGKRKEATSKNAGKDLVAAVENTSQTLASAATAKPERYVEPTPDELYQYLNEIELRRIAAKATQSLPAQTLENKAVEAQSAEPETTAARERHESRSARRRRKWLEKRQLLLEQQSLATEQATEKPEMPPAPAAAAELPEKDVKLKNQRGQKAQPAVAKTPAAIPQPANIIVGAPVTTEEIQSQAGEKTGKSRRNKKKKKTDITPEAVITPEKTPEAPTVIPQRRIIEIPQFVRAAAELIAPVSVEKPTEKDGKKFGSKKAKADAEQTHPEAAKIEQPAVQMPVRRDDKRDNRQRQEPTKIEMPVQPPQPVRRKKQAKVYSVHKNKNLPPLPDELAPLVESVDRFMQSTLFIPDEASIIIGVSGGVDSVAMLDIIANLSLKRGYQITVAHCNHGLRGDESDDDEKLVRGLAGSYRAQYRNAKFNVPDYARKNRTSVENAARMLRYQFFERTARSVGARFVLTAHNADDAAETLLLNLLRGSGLTGLAGMPPRRDLAKKIHLVRPLLQLPKAQLRDYAAKRPLQWREDSSNASKLFMRNKIRHDLLPRLRDEYTPAIADILVRTTRILQGAEAVVGERVEQLSAAMVRQTGNEIRLDTAFFDTVNDFLKGEIIQSIVRKLGAQPVSMNTVDRVIALAGSEIHAECRVTGAITAIRDRSDIVFITGVSAEVYANVGVGDTTDVGVCLLRLTECAKKEVQLGDNPSVEFFDAGLLPRQLTLRTWRDGDSFRPLGLGGSMKISDFLTNIKVSALERKRVLVLCAGSEIIWVCGKRISDSFKITTATKNAVRAEIILPQQLGGEGSASA